ncbi:polyprenyl synthetase family protein [Alkaliflexus imshenetskii]|uniref:polyprenyl synthetase family protein n=1 Tax=Alkaliflexus imshenetskii TaxID=286730 RepID=UPI00047CEB10|nr:polyprenyl synthetase family protein [Alkaliflexus imshenetskii]
MAYIQSFQEEIESALSNMEVGREPAGLFEPVTYILSLGGKRIRPALCLAGCALFDMSQLKDCMHAALGLEVFHNFTLLHDDIMDGSQMRRNHQTVHEKWNVNTAILSGDAMLIKAYQHIASISKSALPDVLTVFSRTAMEVCEGQQYDMEFETRNSVVEDEYINMIRLKTAVLIGGSLEIGAIIGGASSDERSNLYRFGTNIGISFQLQDDWLDVYGDSETFGKAIGGDIVNNKKTFLLINALNNLSVTSRKELEKWIYAKEFNREEKITAVRNLYEEAGVGQNARELMDKYYQSALKHLSLIEGNQEVKSELASFAHQLMERSR